MNLSFNLIDRPWIPCIRKDGSHDVLGLRDVLAQAHHLQEIIGDTPLETAALYRLLLVILHRVFGPKSETKWVELWDRKYAGFDVQRIDAYLTNWRNKFELLDEKYPFYQVANLSELGKPDQINKMLTRLTMDATLFEHTLNDIEQGAVFSLPQAARALITIQSYGFGYNLFVDAPGTKGIIFVIQGDTLFETLAYNLIPYPQEEGDYYSSPDDAPVWENENPFKPIVGGFSLDRDKQVVIKDGKKEINYQELNPLGYLDYLTWQNRKIKLICPDGKTVRQVAWAPGLRLKKTILDPMLSYTKEKDGWKAVSFYPDRALWRDLDTLLKLTDEENKTRPLAALTNLAYIARRFQIKLPKTYRLAAFGLSKSKVRLDFMRHEITPIHLKYLQQDDLLSDVSRAIQYAEKVGKLLKRSGYLLAWLIYNPSTQDKKFDEPGKNFEDQTLIDKKIKAGQNDKGKDHEAQQVYKLFSSLGIERLFWSRLEIYFYHFLQNLPDQPETALADWRDQLIYAARDAFSQAQNYAGADRRSLRAIVHAEDQFEHGLAWILNVQ